MAASCTVFETKRDMGRKKPIFHTNLHVPIEALRIFAQNFYYKLPKLYVVEDMPPEPLFGLLTRTYRLTG